MVQDSMYGIRVWINKKSIRSYDCEILDRKINVDDECWIPEGVFTDQVISQDGMEFLIRRNTESVKKYHELKDTR